jgi:hypothetical protein
LAALSSISRNSPTRSEFLELWGDQRPDAGLVSNVSKVSIYYARLICYAAAGKPKIFHILWNNAFELFDRTLLMLYYRLLGKNRRPPTFR